MCLHDQAAILLIRLSENIVLSSHTLGSIYGWGSRLTKYSTSLFRTSNPHTESPRTKDSELCLALRWGDMGVWYMCSDIQPPWPPVFRAHTASYMRTGLVDALQFIGKVFRGP